MNSHGELRKWPRTRVGDHGGRKERCVAGVLLLSMALTAGCSMLGPAPVDTTTRPPPVEPVMTTDTRPDTAPAVARNETPPAVVVPPPAAILVLKSSDSTSSQRVANTIGELLGSGYELQQADITDTDAVEALRDDGARSWAAAIAIGADAARFATDELAVPTVFCQILDYETLLSQNDRLFGVAALPPLELQLRSWKRIADGADSLGIIVAAQDTELAATAREAAAAAGLDLHVEYAATDREVLYRFKRFAPSVDGLWLLPTDNILSPRVLREVLDYAASHDVQSIVFNETLLQWGALLSVGSDPADVARTVVMVLDTLMNGKEAELARVTPLSTVNVQINEQAAISLGLGAALLTQSNNRTVDGDAP